MTTQVKQGVVLGKEQSVNPVSTTIDRTALQSCPPHGRQRGWAVKRIATMEFLNVRVLSYQPILPEALAEIEDKMNRRTCYKKVPVTV